MSLNEITIWSPSKTRLRTSQPFLGSTVVRGFVWLVTRFAHISGGILDHSSLQKFYKTFTFFWLKATPKRSAFIFSNLERQKEHCLDCPMIITGFLYTEGNHLHQINTNIPKGQSLHLQWYSSTTDDLEKLMIYMLDLLISSKRHWHSTWASRRNTGRETARR